MSKKKTSKKKKKLLVRIANLELILQGQQLLVELLYEFCESVANKEQLELWSYQRLNSLAPSHNDKVMLLLSRLMAHSKKADEFYDTYDIKE